MSWAAAVPMLASSSPSGHDLLLKARLADLGQMAPDRFANLPAVDTHGGTIESIREDDEVDGDGSRVQVLTYEILLPSGDTLTKTIRRKLQVDCLHSVSRVQIVNGKEIGMHTTTSLLQRDIKGAAPLHITQHNLQLDENDPADVAIGEVLRETRERLQSMLGEEKKRLVHLYPQLFKDHFSATQSAPAAVKKETIYNPDGTVTITERSSTKKSFSSHFSKCETYVDGQKQASKTKIRAFVEYEGPEGGFKVRMANGDEELSEDDSDDRQEVFSLSSDRKSALSEIADNESAVCLSSAAAVSSPSASLQPSRGAATGKGTQKERLGKAWHVVKELIDSEQRYVEKLRLLDQQFRLRVIAECGLEREKLHRLFANIESLYAFHDKHFLPQLMDAGREWNTTHRISSVVRKQAPFLKMYSEYVNNYDRATKVFEECKAKNKRFAAVVKEIEKDANCDSLPLSQHFIAPVQRVMRYHLLLAEYKRHLVETDVDFEDTLAAHSLALQGAEHANEMMRKLDRYSKVIEVQEQLGHAVVLVGPGRELLRSGVVHKISSSTGKTEDRFVFLFNDSLVLASERSIPGFSKYKLRAILDAKHMQVCEGDNLERDFSFYVRGSDGGGSAWRTLELFSDTKEQKEEWLAAICRVIDDTSNMLASSHSARMSVCENLKSSGSSGQSRNCEECDAEFRVLSRGYRCSRCNRKLCKKCFGRYRHERKESRACDSCAKHNIQTARPGVSSLAGRLDVLAVPARESTSNGSNGSESAGQLLPAQPPPLPSPPFILHSSFVSIRGSLGKPLRRFLVVRSNFCLYSYYSDQDERALSMLALPGCEVKVTGEKNSFSLRVGSRRLYHITTHDDSNQMRWMAVLDLAANSRVDTSSSSCESESGTNSSAR